MKPKKSIPHTETGIGLAKTLKAAEALTGLPRYVIQSAKDQGCRAFNPNGTVDCDELLSFASKMKEGNSEAIPDFNLENALDKRASRMLKEQKFQERDKLLWPIDKIRQAWARNVIATKTKLQSADNVISTECGMRLALSQEQIDIMRQVIAKTLRDALKELHAGEWGEVKCPECGKDLP